MLYRFRRLFSVIAQLAMDFHSACRNVQYFVPSGHAVNRMMVPDDKVPWSVPWPSYNPPSFTIEGLSQQPWADPELGPNFSPAWNALDKGVNRQSHRGHYEIKDGCPLNPCGRTGLQGRGRLGRWGPNHAVDAIVTRWKRIANIPGGRFVLRLRREADDCKPVLQFVSILRRDTGEWALPGGMVDIGETADNAVKREFFEEALNTPNMDQFFSTARGKALKEFFESGTEAYEGYVDDPRNTDNAWMETVGFHFHDDEGSIAEMLKLKAGDDALKAQWVDVDHELPLYASHSILLNRVALTLDSYW